jgi:hypothetical protein
MKILIEYKLNGCFYKVEGEKRLKSPFNYADETLLYLEEKLNVTLRMTEEFENLCILTGREL